MAGEITLDKEVFKALAGETRVSVLKSLMERRKTQSELAKELNLAAPTIKDHVEILSRVGLVKEVDDGHKWKYIELTVKGKTLLQPQDSRILVLLGTSMLGIGVAGYLAYSRYFSQLNVSSFSSSSRIAETFAQTASINAPLVEDITTKTAGDIAPSIASGVAGATIQVIPIIPITELVVLVFCLVVFGISVGMWIKKTY